MELTNTERLIETLVRSENMGCNTVYFYVGRYTGNGPSVIPALRRRGFNVTKHVTGMYELSRK